jgi:hypothetical protein
LENCKVTWSFALMAWFAIGLNIHKSRVQQQQPQNV